MRHHIKRIFESDLIDQKDIIEDIFLEVTDNYKHVSKFPDVTSSHRLYFPGANLDKKSTCEIQIFASSAIMAAESIYELQEIQKQLDLNGEVLKALRSPLNKLTRMGYEWYLDVNQIIGNGGPVTVFIIEVTYK